MKAPLAAIGLTLVADPALASDVPRLDVAGICQAYVASRPQHRGTPEVQYDDCFVAHQEQYDYLKPLWPKVDQATQDRCWKKATARSSNAYYTARECVEEAITENERIKAAADEAAGIRARSKREFRY